MGGRWLWGTVVACLLAPGTTLGQGVGLGARVGLNVANLGGDDVEDSESKLGASVGAFASVRLTEVLALQPELAWTQKGAEESEGGSTIRFNLRYLEVPVLARITIPSQAAVKAYVLAGPALGVEAGCDVEAEASGRKVSFDCDDPVFQGGINIKSIDIGAVLGGGVGMALGPGQVLGEVRYTLGLSSIDDSPAAEDVKNRVLSFSVGFAYIFPR